MLSDPIGQSRYCFTALASYIADTLEAMMLATVGGKTSPVTMAMYKHFRDGFQHEPRMKSTTLAQLAIVHSHANPLDLKAFFHEVQKFRLNRVAEPFFQDWILAEPSHFFTPESLHHLHKEFFDHNAQWLICAVGESEINFQFSVLQPTTGYPHFSGGISKLKQVTSRYAAPARIITALRELMQFHYLAQSPHLDDDNLKCISGTLQEFHANKDAIIDTGARWGKGNRPITHWHIPKLELMQSIVPSICTSGVTRQWSADVTEHADITEIKDPFELATSLLDCEQCAEEPEDVDPGIDDNIDMHDISPEPQQPGHIRPIMNYFAIARALWCRDEGSVPVPLHSFSIGCTAFHLGYDLSIRNITINEVAMKFGLPDLRTAIADFLQHEVTHGHQHIHAIGGPRRAGPTAALPFDKVQVWFKIRLQETDFHDPHTIQPAQTLNIAPPSGPWTLGCYDTVIVETTF
ncbi:hypothetical protein BDR05DRAFT_1005492 [Suillus weaverae]|nr:hypothetical protein BDR05DRAFT_1005492 [Suillus weaverae]